MDSRERDSLGFCFGKWNAVTIGGECSKTRNHPPSPSIPSNSGASASVVSEPSFLKQKSLTKKILPFEEQLKECKSQSAVLLLVNSQLRAHTTYALGDARLYSSLTDAARYVQLMCAGSEEAQKSVRSSGVLGSLVDAFAFFYEQHLNGHVDPITHSQCVNCWSQICSGLWEAVENPINSRNQELVLGKFIEKNDLKFIEFILTSSKSIDKQTENYVIPIIQLLKALITENKIVQQLIISRNYFIPTLAEGLKIRLQFSTHDPLMWKSIDLMAWLLSMLVPFNKKESLSQESVDKVTPQEFKSSDYNLVQRALAELIFPSLQLVEKDRLAERKPSIGIILMIASLLGRDLEFVQRFINVGGEVILSHIFSNAPPSPLADATKCAFRILNVQKKQLRQKGVGSVCADQDCHSLCSYRQSVGFQQGTSRHGNQMLLPPFQTVPSASHPPSSQCETNYCNYVQAWINTSVVPNAKDSKSSSSGELGMPPPAPPTSVAEESIGGYREPSVFSMPYPHPYSGMPNNNNTPCCGNYQMTPCTPVGCYRSSSPCCRGGMPPSNQIQMSRCGSVCSAAKSKRRQRQRPSPIQNRREKKEKSTEKEKKQIGNKREFDRESMISISIPRKKIASTNVRTNTETLPETSGSGDISGDKLSKILDELNPYEIMETEDHVVVYCSPQMIKATSNSVNNGNESSRPSSAEKERSSKGPKATTGIIGRIFNWLIH